MIDLDFSKTGGLLPAIAQEAETGEVLMLAYMNQEAWEAGHKSCFFKQVENGSVKIIGRPIFDPKEVYKK